MTRRYGFMAWAAAALCVGGQGSVRAADAAVLENAGVRAVFDKAQNGILTAFGQVSEQGRVVSLFQSVQPVFNHCDPSLGEYSVSLGGSARESARVGNDRCFAAQAMAVENGTWRSVAADYYVRVEQRCRLVEGESALEMRWRFETLRDMQESSWTALAALRLASNGYERFCPTHRVEGGAIRPQVMKIEKTSFQGAADQELPAVMSNWFVVRDRDSGEGLLVLFPGLSGRAFLSGRESWLHLLSSDSEDKFVPAGEIYEFALWLVRFRGDFEPVLDGWSRRLGFDAHPSLRPEVSPTGSRLVETDELLVWHELATRKVLREELPPGGTSPGVRIAAAQGEYEPFQLVVRGKEQMPYTRMERMEVVLSDLDRKEGGRIPAQCLSSAVAEFVDLRHPNAKGPDGWSGPTPDTLIDTRLFACEPGKNTLLWITVAVPADAPAGDYDGCIRLYHGMGRGRACVATVPLRVHVFGFAMPEKRHFTAWLPFTTRRGLGLMYESLGKSKEEVEAIYGRFVRNYVAHRAGLRYIAPGVRFKEGSAEIERLALDAYEKELRHFFDDLRVPHVQCRAFNIGAGHVLTPQPFGTPDEVLSPLWRARYRSLARAIGRFLKEKGWTDRVIYELFDEPGDKHIPILAECVKMLKEEFPEIRVTYAAMWWDPRMYGLVNVWVTGGGYSHIPAQRRKAAGDTIWFGNNNLASVDVAAADFRLTWWRYWVDGIAGCVHWTVGESNDWTRRGRWDRNRVATWLLPGEDGPVNTIRWELTREGLEDFEYLWLLEHAVRSAQAAGGEASRAAAEGQRVLDRVKEMVLREGRFLRFNPDPGLLHDVRESMGRQIERMARFLPDDEE